mmetsp:Transcript_49219/g.73194  ORF Transcript_49219/g.73194 Transcript_49219/m.73194 type:complete len:164 (-) Transcript_49219:124-615(-)
MVQNFNSLARRLIVIQMSAAVIFAIVMTVGAFGIVLAKSLHVSRMANLLHLINKRASAILMSAAVTFVFAMPTINVLASMRSAKIITGVLNGLVRQGTVLPMCAVVITATAGRMRKVHGIADVLINQVEKAISTHAKRVYIFILSRRAKNKNGNKNEYIPCFY